MRPFAVIVPHYGSDGLLKDCLDSLEPWSDWIGAVRIIDNNTGNQGFTAACNQGLLAELQDPTGEHLLLLNNDCAALHEPFAPLYDRLRRERAGMVSPMCVSYEDQDKIVWGGAGAVLPGVHKTGSVRLGNCARARRQRWTSFSIVAIRRDLIRQIGLLDAGLKNICSDSDYSLRARAQGWEIWYEAQSVWIHRWRASRSLGTEVMHSRRQDPWRLIERHMGDAMRQMCHAMPTADRS